MGWQCIEREVTIHSIVFITTQWSDITFFRSHVNKQWFVKIYCIIYILSRHKKRNLLKLKFQWNRQYWLHTENEKKRRKKWYLATQDISDISIVYFLRKTMLFRDFTLRSQFIIESIQVIGTETKKFSNKQLQSYSFQKWSQI